MELGRRRDRELEKVSTWDDPGEYMQTVMRCYRRDFWSQQPERVEVWSEKGTIRGVLQPVLDDYGVEFRVMHGFAARPFSTMWRNRITKSPDYPLCRRL